ncbi:hypothetical protein COCSUDRAFT_68343 [Coccomyxa subellipsoidea C-169]|uniref:Quino protein alcohol dehydrogenase-like protein n=1 Tax=Coccomyxa subellipsoidea (strain C-169) TaxID=574566 RepID=I0YIJ4_COCSC|nr:hypothetical protein COCSUDRAFT_68343 [Coccomyxa subellipsoidea C-169]EIE18213.1 hypothetical protein COCSUDRAFT_68343 [Coccomyxa subellipsoidea C-169]|eukprot:XP_005642757.1 hypothetical protein COCSUDRAFT_68343 [Coccomyxa subellipsoidea C-169]
MGRAGGACTAALLLLAGLHLCSCASELNFASVPSGDDVPANQLAKFTSCIVACALEPARIFFPFTGCIWGDKDAGEKSCIIEKTCFLDCFAPAEAHPEGVYTNRYNLERTSFVVEPAFSPATINQTSFAITNQWVVDGSVYAQPLYAPKIKISKGVTKNLVIIATEFNSVYAFDADTGEQVWKKSLTIGRVVNSTDIPVVPSRPPYSGFGPCNDIAPYYGITSTPVIDPETNIVYVMSHSFEGEDIDSVAYRLNALRLETGEHIKGSPTVPVAGEKTFPDSQFPNNATTFRAIKQLNRPGTPHQTHTLLSFINYLLLLPKARCDQLDAKGLVLYKGLVYAAYGSHCDRPPYFPWLFAFSAKSLEIKHFWTSPIFISRFAPADPRQQNVTGGGPTIWQGGTAPTIFNDKLYVVTGRGPVQPENGGYGNAILRFPLDLSDVEDFFIPANGLYLDNVDLDLGSSGAIAIKDKYIITGGKQGPLYIANAANLGGYQPTANNTNVFQVVNPTGLEFNNPTAKTIYSGPAYWEANGGQIFIRGRRAQPSLFRYAWDETTGKLSTQPTAQQDPSSGVGVFQNRASNPVIQAVSKTATEGILWEIDESSSLFGWDAMSLDLIYRSNNTGVCGGTPSSSVGVVKFQLPTIAGGKLYLGCGDRVLIYSLV